MKMSEYIAQANEEELRSLNELIRYRFKELQARRAREVRSEIKVGSTCLLRDIKPKYMIGARVVITALKGDKVTFDILEGPAFRGRSRTNVTAPLSCIALEAH